MWKSTSASGAPDNSSLSHFWLRRAVRNRHRHAIDQASRRWRGGHDSDAQRQFDFHTGDLWEQRTERFQTLMTVSGLLFAGAFALAVEGDLPREARNDCAFPTPRSDHPNCLKLVTLHYSLLASAFGLHLCVISGCLCITRLFSEFMDVRLKGQAVIKRNMKRYSVLLLGMHENSLDSTEVEEAERRLDDALWVACVEINQCVAGLRPC